MSAAEEEVAGYVLGESGEGGLCRLCQLALLMSCVLYLSTPAAYLLKNNYRSSANAFLKECNKFQSNKLLVS